MHGSPRPFVVLPGEGNLLTGRFGHASVLLAGARHTGGSISLLVHTVGPKSGPPLHIHGSEDELWYVLEGEFRFNAGHRMFHAPAGSLMFVPRGIPHAPQNVQDVPSRFLEMYTPAGMERFFEEVSKSSPDQMTDGTYQSIVERASMKIVGPALSESDAL